MKKTPLFLLAMALIAIGTAFATTRPAVKLTETLYYLSGSEMLPITGDGICVESTNFCKYTLIAGQPDDGNPVHYEGVPGEENQQFVPAN